MYDDLDHQFMAQSLDLAQLGAPTCRPNPAVGCVIARDGRVLGRGWHERAGGPHAEVVALADAGGDTTGATAYVTLEPCSHHGRTPPCADALLAAGVARVVVAHEDPFPAVDGRGLERLRHHGVRVEVGLMRDRAAAQNRGYFFAVTQGRPWIRLKSGISLDGRTALSGGQSKWITNALSRSDVQHWRARSCAILTGVDTVLADDPALSVREVLSGPHLQPTRIVLDSQGRMSATARLCDESAPTIVYRGRHLPDDPSLTVERIPTPLNRERIDLAWVAHDMGRRGFREVQVEAGARLSGAWLSTGLVDEILLYIAPCVLGHEGRPLFHLPGPASLADATGFNVVDVASFGQDVRLRMLSKPVDGGLPMPQRSS
ncbi:bifunctional diaminohydroxyphosphoribosylaminopyrimidine deaminase/5-amino-6-(5-phosphoribosylamino)uracil reductase RibD [Pinirhizobacter sp.]|jgi:diaminohydroxyphosphoribosylaminopyrimidine deaminase/5-amino-6-(5-phosphoribosylamino)uracil reductase|uniref:bifunctional diaminohydroxyphosphoribosylaminopyrimidine deaminase/5-amino-6-(5-phosphoribosylamino)uracil reductase RibD n=1 Tax=Pinirhizobacter sp. TaxID=2950432 RepID=UPI0039C9899D